MEGDPRYFDLTPALTRAGVNFTELADWLEMGSIHPFVELIVNPDTGDKHMVYKWSEDSELWVHVGAVEMFCKYLNLETITLHQAVMDRTQGYQHSGVQSTEFLLRRKNAYKRYSDTAGKNKREADRIRLTALILDQENEASRLVPL